MSRPKIPSPDEYRAGIREGIAGGDWRARHEWAKSWISSGGGAHQLDPWLAYVASGLLKGGASNSHSCDRPRIEELGLG